MGQRSGDGSAHLRGRHIPARVDEGPVKPVHDGAKHIAQSSRAVFAVPEGTTWFDSYQRENLVTATDVIPPQWR